MSQPSFTCPFCGTTTRHPDDVRERYCPNCHVFVDDAVRWRHELSDEELDRLAAGTGFKLPTMRGDAER